MVASCRHFIYFVSVFYIIGTTFLSVLINVEHNNVVISIYSFSHYIPSEFIICYYVHHVHVRVATQGYVFHNSMLLQL